MTKYNITLLNLSKVKTKGARLLWLKNILLITEYFHSVTSDLFIFNKFLIPSLYQPENYLQAYLYVQFFVNLDLKKKLNHVYIQVWMW